MEQCECIHKKSKAFGRGSTVWGLISLAVVVGIMFFVGPLVDSKPDKSDFAYGLMVKQREQGGNPDLNYRAVGRYFSGDGVPALDLPVGLKIVIIE